MSRPVRIEVEYEDGTVRRLVGAAAERYLEIEKEVAISGYAHGLRFEPLQWEEVTPSKEPLPEIHALLTEMAEADGHILEGDDPSDWCVRAFELIEEWNFRPEAKR